MGISHADIIDLSRENIDGFDAREFYVKIGLFRYVKFKIKFQNVIEMLKTCTTFVA